MIALVDIHAKFWYCFSNISLKQHSRLNFLAAYFQYCTLSSSCRQSFTKIRRQRKRRPTANFHEWIASYMSSVKGKIRKEPYDSSSIHYNFSRSQILKKSGPETEFLVLLLMSPHCRHLHNHILRAYNWSNVLLFHTKLIVWNHFLRSCGINAFACDLDRFRKQKETRFLWSIFIAETKLSNRIVVFFNNI